MNLLETAKQGLKALEEMNPYPASKEQLRADAMTALRQAIEQAESKSASDCDSPSWCNQYGKCHRSVIGAPMLANCIQGQEPVAFLMDGELFHVAEYQAIAEQGDGAQPLYKAPKAEKQEPVPESNSYSVKRARDVVKALEKRNRKSWDELDREAVFAIDALVAAFEFQFYRANSAPVHDIDINKKCVDETAKDKHEPDVYGDGNVYRGQRSKDSTTRTLHWSLFVAAQESLREQAEERRAEFDNLVAQVRALEQAEKQEPVAWMGLAQSNQDESLAFDKKDLEEYAFITPLYTAPPNREWVGLTDDEVNEFAAGCHLGNSVQGAIYKAQAKLKEKNGG